jgi:hypothetical protein
VQDVWAGWHVLAQAPFWHTPVQHSLAAAQGPPGDWQPLPQIPLGPHSWLQQAMGFEHGSPSGEHMDPPQMPRLHVPTQQSASCMHVLPCAAHDGASGVPPSAASTPSSLRPQLMARNGTPSKVQTARRSQA